MFQKLLFGLCLTFAAFPSFSQNIRLHYDFRHSLYDESAADRSGKNFLFSTVEMFRPDKYGSTFFFIDMTYAGKNGAVNSAYWEIARDLRFWEFPVALHLEYNGGLTLGGSIPNAYLPGISYEFAVGKTRWCTYVAYRYNAFDRASHDAQWTVTWFRTMFSGKVTLCGFMDLWSENKDRIAGTGGKRVVLCTQPEFWVNIFSRFSLGGEVEISANFYGPETFILPSLAAKWKF